MANSLILILSDLEEKQKLKEHLGSSYQTIDELGEFFYLQEELALYQRPEDFFKLEAYYNFFVRERLIIAFSSNFSRAFWSKHLKIFKTNFDYVQVFNLQFLRENLRKEGKQIFSEPYMITLRKFLIFWNKNFRVQHEYLYSVQCDFFFVYKPMGSLRLEHYSQLAARYGFKFYYLNKRQRLRGFQFFYEHCLGLMLKEVLGLFHEHQSTRHSSQ
jgi:hypothetical protein